MKKQLISFILLLNISLGLYSMEESFLENMPKQIITDALIIDTNNLPSAKEFQESIRPLLNSDLLPQDVQAIVTEVLARFPEAPSYVYPNGKKLIDLLEHYPKAQALVPSTSSLQSSAKQSYTTALSLLITQKKLKNILGKKLEELFINNPAAINIMVDRISRFRPELLTYTFKDNNKIVLDMIPAAFTQAQKVVLLENIDKIISKKKVSGKALEALFNRSNINQKALEATIDYIIQKRPDLIDYKFKDNNKTLTEIIPAQFPLIRQKIVLISQKRHIPPTQKIPSLATIRRMLQIQGTKITSNLIKTFGKDYWKTMYDIYGHPAMDNFALEWNRILQQEIEEKVKAEKEK